MKSLNMTVKTRLIDQMICKMAADSRLRTLSPEAFQLEIVQLNIAKESGDG